METLFSQRENYAVITPLKNYNRIDDQHMKDLYYNGYNYDNVFYNYGDIHEMPKPFRNKNGYYHKASKDERFVVRKMKLNGKNSFKTYKQKNISEHYANPFSEVSIIILERKIIKKGNKITFKIYSNVRYRKANLKYFTKYTESKSITIDTITGNITTCIYKRGNKENIKVFRTNNFYVLYNILMETQSYFFNQNSNDSFLKIVNEVLGSQNIVGGETFYNSLVRKFIEHKNYKQPDNFHINNIILFYPNQKLVCKNKNNICNAVLDFFGIKSKATVRFMNKTPNANPYYLFLLCNLFGEDFGHYLSKLNPNFFPKHKNMYDNPFTINKYNYKSTIQNIDEIKGSLNHLDKQNLITFLGSMVDLGESTREAVFINLYDHFRIISGIRKFGVKVRFKAKTIDEFNIEHEQYSKMFIELRKDFYVERTYDERLIKAIEQHTVCNGEFKFVLLKTELDYIHEGNYMHHCVGTYATKENSMIVSIHEVKGTNRATCEFDMMGTLVQARSLCNQTLGDNFMRPLSILENIIKQQKNSIGLKPLKIETIKKNSEHVASVDGFLLF